MRDKQLSIGNNQEGGNAMTQKMCFTASLGGHLEEIAKLVELGNLYDIFLVTEKGGFIDPMQHSLR